MKGTINNTHPEVSSNQILYAGFELFKILEDKNFKESFSCNNMIVFILNGSVKIYSSHKEIKSVGEQYMIFLKMYDKYTCEIAPYSKILVFTFDSLPIDELLCFKAQYNLLPESAYEWTELKMIEPLITFLSLISLYLENNFPGYSLYASKRDELFCILKTLYTRDDLSTFFYLLISLPTEFEKQVTENCMKAKNVKELASLLGYGLNSFRIKFRETFGVPAYQWLLNEKAKRILKCLAIRKCEFKDIIDDFNFSSHSHFYKFCKIQFGLTPEELRNKLNG